jgi:hypothetical protein
MAHSARLKIAIQKINEWSKICYGRAYAVMNSIQQMSYHFFATSGTTTQLRATSFVTSPRWPFS